MNLKDKPEGSPAYNSTSYKKLAVQWLNEALLIIVYLF
jgi:hypothetical protein